MVREALNAESSKDFIHKLSIAQKEIGETIYWLELLEAAQYLDPIQAQSLRKDAEEILKMLTSIIKTTKKKLSAPPTNN
jgi:four helix bundle protein